jgi:type I restriction enzyme S subunit
MSRIEELIEELCPEGVEFRELGDICNIFIGSFVKKTEHNLSYEYPVYNGGIQPTGYFNNFNSNKNCVVLSARGANCGFVNYLTVDFWAGNSCYVIKELSEKVNSKFLFYFLKCKEINLYILRQTSGIPAINSAPLSKFPIPIPPLPIQQEIVTILDTFTALDAQLQAELEARRKQYEHYRNELLNFEGKEVEWKTLGEVGKFIRGKRFVKNDIVSEGIPCIHYGEMYTYYKTWTKKTKSFLEPEKAEKLRFAKPGDVIIVTAGETIEDIGNAVAWLGETNVVIHDACFAYSHNFNPKFVSYYFQTDLFRSQIRKHISSSKISAILESGLSQATIPIPPLIEQERIVGILDKFEALVSGELPAEIAARRKQYEYYREKLLKFEPLTTNH